MYRPHPIPLCFMIIVLLCFWTASFSQAPETRDRWGLGIATNYYLPIFKLNDRFDGAPKIGAKWSYFRNEITYEICYFYSGFSSGKIEDSKFQWVYDGNYYPSPNASSEIVLSGVVGNLQRPFNFSLGPFSPFWSIGAGFIYFKHKIENLVFPGQSIPPLDLNFIYSPEEESRTSLSVNFGGGIQYNLTQQINLALTFKYHVIFGHIRPMEAWYMEKVSPLQLIDFGLDFTYYLTK